MKELLDVVTRVFEYQRPHPALVGTATLGDQSHRTAKAIAWLRANYTKPLRVEELAEVARVGMSTLHHHFRAALTAMSPLQYQKRLRLVTAIGCSPLPGRKRLFRLGPEWQFNAGGA